MRTLPESKLPWSSTRSPEEGLSEGELSRALLRLYATNQRNSMASLPVATGLVALVATRWVPWEMASGWYLLVLAFLTINERVFGRFLEADPPAGDLEEWKRRISLTRLGSLFSWSLCSGAVFVSADPAVPYVLLALLGFPMFANALVSAPWSRIFALEATPLAIGGAGVLLASGGSETSSLLAIGTGFGVFCFLFSSRLQQEAIRKVSLEHGLSRAKDAAESARSRLERLATTDELTGILNRRAFLERAEQEVWRAKRYDHSLALLMLDVDHFKDVNDRHGHSVGDEVLEALAATLQRFLRRTDILARLGGEEFVVMLPETPGEVALKVGERLRQSIEQLELAAGDEVVSVTMSVGVTSLQPDAGSVAEILDSADRALYAAKAAGRNRVESADGEG